MCCRAPAGTAQAGAGPPPVKVPATLLCCDDQGKQSGMQIITMAVQSVAHIQMKMLLFNFRSIPGCPCPWQMAMVCTAPQGSLPGFCMKMQPFLSCISASNPAEPPCLSRELSSWPCFKSVFLITVAASATQQLTLHCLIFLFTLPLHRSLCEMVTDDTAEIPDNIYQIPYQL